MADAAALSGGAQMEIAPAGGKKPGIR